MRKLFSPRWYVPLLTLAVVVLLALGALLAQRGKTPLSPTLPTEETRASATPEQIHSFCSACHAYPPPDTFPRADWKVEVARGYEFFSRAKITRPSFQHLQAPLFTDVVRYYEERAPETIALHPPQEGPGTNPVHFERTCCPLSREPRKTSIANVNLVHLWHEYKLDLLACDMKGGRVLAVKPYESKPTWTVLGNVPHPAHAEVVDLDGDGIRDILVADLGSFPPTDDRVGQVVLLKGTAKGKYVPLTLLKNVGRVADVQAADFNGDGKLDLIVAVFGLYTSGSILYLENQTTDWSRPVFVPHVIDSRQGAIHVPIAYLNGDKKRPDFVALISQEHETVVAFLNDGKGRFQRKTIYAGPHPAFGSTGIQLVDLDGDGRQDVLLSNGDVLDPPFRLRPYHGIQWLENRGQYPFVAHHLTSMYGVHRAVAADFRGNGKKDIVAVSFLPAEYFPESKEKQLDSVILLEQTTPGQFVRHSLEKGTCDHATCAVGAWDGDGRNHLVIGHFASEGYQPPGVVTLWKNSGPRTQTRARGREHIRDYFWVKDEALSCRR